MRAVCLWGFFMWTLWPCWVTDDCKLILSWLLSRSQTETELLL